MRVSRRFVVAVITAFSPFGCGGRLEPLEEVGANASEFQEQSGPARISVGGDRATCAWLPGDALACWGGYERRAPFAVALPGTVRPGAPFDVGTELCVVATDGILCGPPGDFGSARRFTTSSTFADVNELAVSGGELCARLGREVRCGNLRGNTLDTRRLTGASQLFRGEKERCATVGDALQCWGDDGAVRTAIQVAELRNAAVGYVHRCAVYGNGATTRVRCVGVNRRGLLGDGSDAPIEEHEVAEAAGARAVVAGTDHGCALLGDGGVLCWGSNGLGELGTADRATPRRPERVPNLPPLVELAANGDRTCGRAVDQQIYCWGADRYQQSGGQSPLETPRIQAPGTPITIR